MSSLTTVLTLSDLQTLRDKVFQKHLNIEEGKIESHVLCYTDTQLALCQYALEQEFAQMGKRVWCPEDKLPPRSREIYISLILWLFNQDYQMGWLFTS